MLLHRYCSQNRAILEPCTDQVRNSPRPDRRRPRVRCSRRRGGLPAAGCRGDTEVISAAAGKNVPSGRLHIRDGGFRHTETRGRGGFGVRDGGARRVRLRHGRSHGHGRSRGVCPPPQDLHPHLTGRRGRRSRTGTARARPPAGTGAGGRAEGAAAGNRSPPRPRDGRSSAPPAAPTAVRGRPRPRWAGPLSRRSAVCRQGGPPPGAAVPGGRLRRLRAGRLRSSTAVPCR